MINPVSTTLEVKRAHEFNDLPGARRIFSNILGWSDPQTHCGVAVF
jgi:hypothetical protein